MAAGRRLETHTLNTSKYLTRKETSAKLPAHSVVTDFRFVNNFNKNTDRSSECVASRHTRHKPRFFPPSPCGAAAQRGAKASSILRFLDHTKRRTKVGRTGRVISASQRPLPDNTQHSQHTNIHTPVGFFFLQEICQFIVLVELGASILKRVSTTQRQRK